MWPDSDSTRELLDRLALADDPAAADRLWARHREPLRRMIDMRLDRAIGRRVDASDVVQDVLIEASRRLGDYLRNPAMPFHLWLRQIARDRMIDEHRRHRVAARRSLDRERSLAAPEYADR
ncbi:MAG TPA: sigma factor, partial [Isosphaeraceae bacterium]|nr:sigma factor [Isosphaeraceae bacterium]